MLRPARRLRRLGLACAIVLIGLAALPAPVLRRTGHLLVVDEPIGPSDAIVIAVDAPGAGVAEAVDLYRRGIAPRVAVFGTPPEDEYADRDEPKDDADRALRRLAALAIPSERIEPPVSGTTVEGRALLDWCRRKGFKRVVIVTRTDHARRLRRVINRSVPRGSIEVAVRFSRYSEFDPDRWWQTRRGIQTAIEELAKLAADIVLHPRSGPWDVSAIATVSWRGMSFRPPC